MHPLGTPLPDAPHAVSVSLPDWKDVVDYEEGKPRVVDALRSGYPRFVYHPIVRRLFAEAESKYGKPGEFCLIFPSENSAEEFLYFVRKRSAKIGRTQQLEKSGIYAAFLPESERAVAKEFWQHSGFIISSRQADDYLNGRNPPDASDAKKSVKKRISELSGYNYSDIYLYPSGASAIFSSHHAITRISPGLKTIQLGFPYVDTLKVQEKFGSGVYFINYKDTNDLAALEKIIANERIGAIFCEIPSNPLLKTIDLEKLSKIISDYNIPLIIDDTISSWANVDLSPYADIIVTSLTKFFSGVGDVLAGSLIINHKSRFYNEFKESIDKSYEDLLYPADAEVLEQNSRDFIKRMKKINYNAENLVDFLKSSHHISQVNYPKFINNDAYEKIKKEDGGYSGLLSFTLKDPANAPIVYDALKIDKGPSLGTNFTLASPYTLLAHYSELDKVRKHGIESHLIRVSVGIEESADIIRSFAEALAEIEKPTKKQAQNR